MDRRDRVGAGLGGGREKGEIDGETEVERGGGRTAVNAPRKPTRRKGSSKCGGGVLLMNLINWGWGTLGGCDTLVMALCSNKKPQSVGGGSYPGWTGGPLAEEGLGCVW